MRLISIAVCGALLATSLAAVAQATRGDVVVDVPFAFQVGGQALPAGHYIVAPKGDAVQIFDSQTHSLFVPVHSASRAADSESKLVFHRYGDSYFLSEVWVQGNTIGKELFPSRSERELRTRKAEMELAVVRPASADSDKPHSDK